MKDAQGHGSNPKGAHSEGVEKIERPIDRQNRLISELSEPEKRLFDEFVKRGKQVAQSQPKNFYEGQALRNVQNARTRMGSLDHATVDSMLKGSHG